MAQFGRPSVDTYIGGYKDQADGTTNIWNSIDEVTYSDTDYVKSALAPASAPYVCKLTTVEDPLSSSNHVVRFRYCKDAAGGATIGLTVELRQGYVNEGSMGTLIATSGLITDIGASWTAGSINLSAGEADSITNYADLYLRFVANQT
jgi:hypothetical protein